MKNKEIQRPRNMSQLDYLWTTYGSYKVSNEVDTENDSIPTSSAIRNYITSIGEGITELDSEEIDGYKIKIIGKNPSGQEVSSIQIDSDTKISSFLRHVATQTDVDNGLANYVGEHWLVLKTNTGMEYWASVDDLFIRGQESDTIINQTEDGKISSSVKINNPIINKSVDLKTSTSGLWADLVINPNTKSRTIIVKGDNGIECKFNWEGTETPVALKSFDTFDEYQLTTIDPGTIYLVKDVKSIYFGGIKYSSVGIDPQDYYTKDEVYNKEQVDALPHVNAYSKSETDALLNKKADIDDIPTALPNPNALVVNYNGEIAFTYDGSRAETGNFIVNADTVPGIDEKVKSISYTKEEVDSMIIPHTNAYTKEESDAKYATKATTYTKEETYSKQEVDVLVSNSIDAYTKQESDSKYATIETVNNKVDKVVGKQLSTEDYTTAEKQEVAKIANKVDKVNGKGLSTNDYTAEDKAAVGTIADKVDKVEGKQLSTEDYTTEEKAKLEGIEENANNYTHPTTAGNKHIPSGGTTGQMLVNTEDGTAEWADVSSKLQEKFDLLNTMWQQLQEEQTNLQNEIESMVVNEDVYSYGVEWDVTVADPALTRIGNPLLHKQLPIQSSFRGCVAEGPIIKYWLNPNDWSLKENGEPSVLDGTDGTVRVNTMKFYGKSGSKSNKRWVKISTVKIDDTWVEIPELLIDAYRCTVDTTTSSTPKAVSVVNTTAQFRGGGNRADRDTYLESDAFRTDLGKPRTNTARANMRTYATNAGSELLCYEYYKWIFYWCWVIEYATFNSQAAYNAELTSEGYHQGGLGDGVTTWDGTSWNNYNGYYPLTPCGYGNDIGNFTGIKDLVIPDTTVSDSITVATKTFKMPRWRGFDNPFGDIGTNLEGIVIKRNAANEDSNVYTTIDPEEFTDEIGSKSVAGIEVAKDGYIKAFDLGRTGEIIPSEVGGFTTTYMCDYHWCNSGNTALRTLLVGSGASYGSDSGLGCFDSTNGVGDTNAIVGFRTIIRLN